MDKRLFFSGGLWYLMFLLLPALAGAESFAQKLAVKALERTKHSVVYDGRYIRIPYPGGDVPAGIGVCTDVVIRAYRTLGIDLQKEVHKDMKKNFLRYPSKKNWGLSRPDTNIDHRRVPNLQTFFTRKGEKLPVTKKGTDYKAGDIVTWRVQGNLPHIGIISTKYSLDNRRPLVVHNIGRGPKLEDMLFSYLITGHYRYFGPKK